MKPLLTFPFRELMTLKSLHTSVFLSLKAGFEGNAAAVHFCRLKLADISLNCLRALLEYLYTFEISRAVKSPKVAVDLFVAANKYEIQPLQDKLAKMILERRIGWFHITPTLDLFLCVRKLGKTTTNDELKKDWTSFKMEWEGTHHAIRRLPKASR
ncbi:BTB/POZ domain-containing protein [Orchesella cincta]|uniref:BTB/POZ domain-containing protein n=1 Tax=Orchesella cincta TaxID=48709 RepID=A0A1D2M4Q8_ORCCI|nr:BTB/POZ domain-containing protein [Orchesella cincta]